MNVLKKASTTYGIALTSNLRLLERVRYKFFKFHTQLNFQVMNDEEHKIPDWFQDIEGYVRQYCELKRLSSQLAEVLRVPFTEETTTRMGVRISVERDIRSRMDYLEEIITLNVVKQFEYLGILSKFPELHTSHNEK